jgi:multiple sugar transport system ATP-binding protein
VAKSVLGIRHGHPRVLPETATGGLPGRLYTIEPTGDVTFVHFYVGNALLVASTTELFRGSPDQPLRIEFDQQHLYLFDRETEQAL